MPRHPSRLRGRRQHLGHEEGIPARDSVQALGGPPGLARELRDRRFRQRCERHPVSAPARQLPHHEPQRVPRAELVIAIRRRQHGARAVDAPAEILEQIERGLIRPVQVFEYDQRRRALELIERRAEYRVGAGGGIDRGQQPSFGLARDIV